MVESRANTARSIPSLLATLMERLEGRESLDLELKSAKGGIPKDLWPTVSAFANTSGGWIILGVDEHGGGVAVGGVANAHDMLKSIHDQMRNPQKISCETCGVADSTIESLGDKQVIVLRVPAAPRKMRPVYINGNPYEGTFVRRHSGDYHCTRQEVNRMMREASDAAADSAILAGFDWNDIDRESLALYRRRFQTQNPPHPWNAYDDQRFLQAIGGFRRDRETGAEGITVAGLLLVGTPAALQEWRTRHLIDYRLVSAEAQTEAGWIDRLVWEGNLLGAFGAIYSRLTEGLPVPFRLDAGTRVDEGPVHVALREALVNLLVHADYAEPQASLIKRTPEGYLFRNPGSSRVSEADLFTGDRSDPRNPQLVRMFRHIGLAEEAGSGMPRILRSWRQMGFRLPDVEVGTERYEFTLHLRHVHLLSEEDRDWLRSLGSHWEEPEQLALVIARHEGYIDNLGLRKLTGQHPADVTKVLGGLRDRDLLQMIGVGRGAKYELGPMATGDSEPLFKGVRGTQTELPGLGTELGPSSRSPEGISPSPEGISPSPEGISPSPEGFDPGSAALRTQLEEISRVAMEKHHLDPATRDATIIALCELVPLSLDDLSDLLARSKEYLRSVLRELIRSGRLSYTYPRQPSHPRQKYTTPKP